MSDDSKLKIIACRSEERSTLIRDFDLNENGYCELIYFIAGEGIFWIVDARYVVGPATVFISSGSDKFSIKSVDRKKLKFASVFLFDKGDCVLLENTGLAVDTLIKIKNPRTISGVIDHIIELTEGRKNPDQSVRLLLKFLLQQMKAGSFLGANEKCRSVRIYERALEELNSHYMRYSSVCELSSVLNIEPSYLARLFKKYGNETPLQRLVRLKMEKAVEMLFEDKFLIKEISADLGYRNQLYFSQVFRKYYGLSPLKYVKKVQGSIGGLVSGGIN